jgi:hypothetical protein
MKYMSIILLIAIYSCNLFDSNKNNGNNNEEIINMLKDKKYYLEGIFFEAEGPDDPRMYVFEDSIFHDYLFSKTKNCVYHEGFAQYYFTNDTLYYFNNKSRTKRFNDTINCDEWNDWKINELGQIGKWYLNVRNFSYTSFETHVAFGEQGLYWRLYNKIYE